jgi:hypothetical protein
MPLNWIKKLLNGTNFSRGTEVADESAEASDEQSKLNEFRAYIAREIAAGYGSPNEALETSVDVMSDEIHLDILTSKGPQILKEELAAHIQRQADWPEVTDCDRLDATFAALEDKGIVSRQNFSCCGTCGSSEIWDEINIQRSAGVDVQGYTFFHMQDTESAVEGFGLYLNYGSTEDGEESSVSIGRDIQNELHKFGLQTDWDGKLSKRIRVPLNWQRRIKLPILH